MGEFLDHHTRDGAHDERVEELKRTIKLAVPAQLPSADALGLIAARTRKYKVHRLVWFREFADVREAIQRGKTMKGWPRAWKTNLTERTNPHWDDLYPSLPGVRPPSIKGVR